MTRTGEQLKEDGLNAIRSVTPQATMTAKEGARYIGLSYWKILELVKARQIPCVRISDGAGGRVLFRKESLDRWLAEREAASIEQEPQQAGKIRRLK